MIAKKFLKILLGIVLVIMLAVVVFFGICFGPSIGEALFDRPSKPKVKHGEFPFELVYEYDGEQVTINETIVCEYEGISFSLDGGNSRDWNCYITNNERSGQYYLNEEKYPTLHIQIPLDGDYYMGDPEANPEYAKPYLFLVDDSTGTTYYEQDLMDVVGAKIISWEVAAPLENNMKKLKKV